MSRLAEAINLCEEKKSGDFRGKTSHIFEEIVSFLNKDPVALKKLEDRHTVIKSTLEDTNKSIDEKLRTVTYLYKVIKIEYREELEKTIIECINSKKKDNEKLYLCCRQYGSFLVNQGYSNNYIFHATEEAFFKDDIKKSGETLMKKFFNSFDMEERTYRVYFTISKKLKKLLRELLDQGLLFDQHDKLKKIPNKLKTEFPDFFNDPNTKVLSFQTKKMDPYKAKSSVQDLLDSLISLSLIRPHKTSYFHIKEALVVKQRKKRQSDPIIIGRDPSIFRRGEIFSPSVIKKSLSENLETIVRSFNIDGRSKILNSITARGYAVASKNEVTQLLSLWSAIEVLSGTDSISEKRIIKRVTDNLLPLICLKYSEHKLSYIVKFIRMNVSNYELDYLANIDGENVNEKTFKLLSDENNKDKRDDLFQETSHNPLLTWRIFELAKTLQCKTAFKKHYDGHKSRVKWQLNRIYRSRNYFAHRAISQVNLFGLIMNLDNYYRTAINHILEECKNSPHEDHLEQILLEATIKENLVEQHLKNTKSALSFSKAIQVNIL